MQHRNRWIAWFIGLTIIVSLSRPVIAQAADDQSNGTKVTSIDSPRYMMRQFLDVIKRDELDQAIPYIEFPRRMSLQRQKVMVRQLVEVLNKRGQIDVALISDDPNGRLMDGLLPDAEVIGRISYEGEILPIELRRSLVTEEGRRVWRFAAEFMEKIPSLAEKLEDRAFEAHMPRFMIEYSGFGIKIWQWCGLVLTILIAWVFSSVCAFILIKIINLSTRRFWHELSDQALRRLVPPLRWITGLLVFQGLTSFLELKINIRQTLQYLESVALGLAVTFLLMRLIETFIEIARMNLEKQGRASASGMLQPIQKGGKVLVVVSAAIWVFRGLGFDVTAIIAGLGVGGLAIALAGQKTIENLFGGVSVLLDQPVRVGDAGRFGEVIGTVEDIGLRSTKVRTLDRTLVTIPNAEFSLMKIENFERRDKIRWLTTLSLRYETQPDQMRLLLMRLKELLIGHPMVLNDPARVRFLRLGVSGLDVEIFCFICTGDYNEYLSVVEDLNLKIMEIVAACGSGFAFPSSTVYLERSKGLDPEKVDEAMKEVARIGNTVGFPQPHYPQEWIEPRADVLTFGPSSPRKAPS